MLKTVLTAAVLALIAEPVAAQNITAPDAAVPTGITVEAVQVHGASLESNLEGNEAAREVMVVLPPSYAENPDRHYPVVYYLHGFAISGRDFYDYMQVPTAVAANAAQGREFIVVVPDTLTAMGGSMYANSVTTGNFRDFIAIDLVAYMDAHYRTIPTREGRGLVGHSMGGHGTWVVGMTHPGVFAALWAQSACCVSPRTETPASAAAMAAVPRDGVDGSGFGMRAGLASAVAWAPNPQNPPFFVDFPLAADGSVDPLVIARWANNSPLAMVAGHLSALRSYDAIGADVGDKDGLLADDTLIHLELEKFGVAHDWAVYDGNHVDRIGARFDNVVLPWMARHLTMGEWLHFAPENPGLVLHFAPDDQQRRSLADGTQFIEVAGTITNTGEREVQVPPLLMLMRDDRNDIVFQREIDLPPIVLGKGEVLPVTEMLFDLPPTARFLEIGWLER